MKRRAPDAARGGLLAVGVVVGIEQAQSFGHAFGQIAAIALKRLRPPDIDIAQIERLFAGIHPCGQRHARPARRLNADGVEPGGDPDIVHLIGQPKVIGIVGGKTLWPVKEGVDPRRGQHRHPVDGGGEDRLKMVEILGQLVKFEPRRNAIHCPWF